MIDHKQESVALRTLKVADYNPRLMPEDEMANLKRAIKEFGLVQPIVARKEDGLIIGGHQRVQAYASLLKDRGLTQKEIDASPVPVIFVKGLNDSKTKLLNVALNKIHGDWDTDKLSALFASLDKDAVVELSGFSKDEVDGMLSLATAPPVTASLGNVAQDVEDSLGEQKPADCANCTKLKAEIAELTVENKRLVEAVTK
jgi:ParB-like chromosome segregation protein Spo0J